MRRSLKSLAALTGTALALLFAYRTASSAPPAASASAGAPSDKPTLPAFSSVSWPDEASKPPSLDEWKAAEELSVRGGGASSCRVRRVREWVRLRCLEGATLGVEQIAGPQVHAIGVEAGPGAYAGVGTGGAVFPVRRGDRRILQWFTPRYTSVVETESGVVITEQWLPEDPGPMITVDEVEKLRGPVTGY
jgi:hypothetical protein